MKIPIRFRNYEQTLEGDDQKEGGLCVEADCVHELDPVAFGQNEVVDALDCGH